MNLSFNEFIFVEVRVQLKNKINEKYRIFHIYFLNINFLFKKKKSKKSYEQMVHWIRRKEVERSWERLVSFLPWAVRRWATTLLWFFQHWCEIDLPQRLAVYLIKTRLIQMAKIKRFGGRWKRHIWLMQENCRPHGP